VPQRLYSGLDVLASHANVIHLIADVLFETFQQLHEAASFETVRNGREGAYGDAVESALFAEAAVLRPQPLQVKVHRTILQRRFVFLDARSKQLR